MRLEIIHHRDPDAPCRVDVYIDGERVADVEVFDVDPGAGYELLDWQESTEHAVERASERVAVALRSVRDEIARESEYIDRSCAASSVSEVLDEGRANDAGISSRFQCDDCGKVLSSLNEPHDLPIEREHSNG